MSVELHGETDARFASVADAFQQALDDFPHNGAALAVRHEGHLVVDLWGGVADSVEQTPWSRDTASVIFSCTKGLMSILAAQLVQEGVLDYETPVARYWPEFAQAGKERVLVSHLLAHRSGLSAPRVNVTFEQALDWDFMTALLAAQEPLWEPGTAYSYHAITHGWLVGEVVSRAAGVPVQELFSSRLSEPFGGELWLGLPEQGAPAVATLTVGVTLRELIEQQQAALVPGVMDWPHHAMTLGAAFPASLAGPAGTGFNDPRLHRAIIPGAGGIATARGLATAWSATVVPTEGVRLLGDEVIARATVVQSEGQPLFGTPGPWPRWGMGFQRDSEARRYLGEASFGHDGAGGQVGFADSETGIGFGFVTNRMEAGADPRATRVVEALKSVLAH